MHSAIRTPLPLAASEQPMRSPRRRASGSSAAGGPGKVTTLEDIISSQTGRKDTFCGQNARSSLGGVASMSKSFSGSRSVLDHRTVHHDTTNSDGQEERILSSGKYGQFNSLKLQKQRPRSIEKRNSTSSYSAAPELLESQGGVGTGSGSLEEYPDALRQEISDLQQALIDKYRGTNKMVSGAQFRSSGPGNHKCDLCESKDHSLKKAKETIRSLRFQLSQTEEKLFSKTSGGSRYNNGSNSARGQGHLTEEWATIRERNEELLARVSGLEHSNRDLKHQLETERRRRDERQRDSWQIGGDSDSIQRLQKEHQDAVELSQSLRDASIEKDKMMKQLKDQLNLKCDYAKDLEDEIACQKQAYQEAPNRSEFQDVVSRLEQAETTANLLRSELDAASQQLAASQSESKAIASEKNSITQMQQDQLQELNELKAAVIALQSKLEESERCVVNSKDEAIDAQATVKKLQNEITDLKECLAERNSRISDLESDLVSVRKDGDEANIRMNAMVKRMTLESENSAKAVQKAISSSVRLCVVAPTVNVHVADKKMKFRSNVPKEDLERFLRDQVLSKYTFLFEQAKENAGPDGVTDLQPWIKKVLAEMQESVENHISSAMKNNGH